MTQPPPEAARPHTLPEGAVRVALLDGRVQTLPREVPVALVFDGVTQAVMMATPDDLTDFLTGFALTEGLIARAAELTGIEVVAHPRGIEARGWLPAPSGEAFRARRRAMAGPVGCGLCGIDSLEQALRPLAAGPQPHTDLTPETAARALEALRPVQHLQDATRATHAAGFWSTAADAIVAIREDVGRHNALDKLAGALARAGQDPGQGAVVMTSRLSVDLVQKAAMIGARCIVAPSAPTALAVDEARAAGVALIARATGGLARYC